MKAAATEQHLRLRTDLPDGFDRLLDAARLEGVRNMDRLRSDWLSGVLRFDGPGEALFAAYLGADLAGVGGLTGATGVHAPAMRLRRFYVHPRERRSGVGRRLAEAVIREAFRTAPMAIVNAGGSPAAAPFWEALGFERTDGAGYTHQLRRRP